MQVEEIEGPSWADELLKRLCDDRRVAPRLDGARRWADVPVAAVLDPPTATVPGAPPTTLSYFTSGTTGAPKRVDYTDEDWRETVAHRARCLAASGVAEGDNVGVLLPFGPWFSGDNVTEALLALGAAVLPGGVYLPHLPAVAATWAAHGMRLVVTTPSIALHLAGLGASAVDRLVLVGEHVSPVLRRRLSEGFPDATVRSIFATSEVILGHEDPGEAGRFIVDPEWVHVEVLDDSGAIRPSGTGELVVTRRYGMATPLVRYRLGDRVELCREPGDPPAFRYLGRVGHGVSLAAGVKVTRAQLEAWLDDLPAPVAGAHIVVEHGDDGRDHVRIALEADDRRLGPDLVAAAFRALSFEVLDVAACGFLEVTVRVDPPRRLGKRALTVEERPWAL
jgi:phenylacetate-coenzyme A ligase PaaK-like adenylate-forming protein